MQRQRSNEVCLRKWRKTPETMSVWKTQRVVHWGSWRQPPGSPIHSDSLTQHIVAHTAISYHSDRAKSTRKKCMGWSWGETRRKLPRIFSQWSHIGPTSFPQECVVTILVKYCQPGKFVETQHLGCLLGAGHTGTLCLPCTNITHSRRETSLQHKPYCSHTICKWATPTTSGNGEHCSNI